jgi:hypothetical protein
MYNYCISDIVVKNEEIITKIEESACEKKKIKITPLNERKIAKEISFKSGFDFSEQNQLVRDKIKIESELQSNIKVEDTGSFQSTPIDDYYDQSRNPMRFFLSTIREGC